jgi:hypothetical protein
MPGDRGPVRSLVAKIELEMLGNRASLVQCRYSDEPFNTSDVIAPHWRDIPFHPASLISLTSLAVTVLIGAWALTRCRFRAASAG